MIKFKKLSAFLFLSLFAFSSHISAQSESEKLAIEYICPMYCTDLVSDKPGTCPDCMMDLEDKKTIENPTDYKLVTTQELHSMIESKEDILLLDVRSTEEFDGELKHLDNAMLIPIKELENRLSELSGYREKKIIVYCSHGIRSERGAKLLLKNGYDAYSLTGGLTKWERDKNSK